MNVLILVNNAPGFARFALLLADKLEALGHKVSFALDSPLILAEYEGYNGRSRLWMFSDYLAAVPQQEEIALEDVVCDNWSIWFSEFDRFENFGINLGSNKGMRWYQALSVALVGFFRGIYAAEATDIVVFEGLSGSFPHFAYLVGKEMGVPYFGISSARVPGRFEIHQGVSGVRAEMEANFFALRTGMSAPKEVVESVAQYLRNFEHVTPDYIRTNQLELTSPWKKYLRADKLRLVWGRMKYVLHHTSTDFPYVMGNPLLFSYHQGIRWVRRWVSAKMTRRYFLSPDLDSQFFLYPLHFHPEASTSVYAPYYVDEYVTIKNIAFSLPFGAYLYVKDHVSAVGFPGRDFYRRVANLPNVRLLAPDEDTKSLIRRCVAVVTLTSTVGFEAIVLGKRVFLLGDTFYDFHPLCRKVSSWHDLAPALRTALHPREEDGDALTFLAAYWMSTHPGNVRFGGPTDPGAGRFVDVVANQIATFRSERN